MKLLKEITNFIVEQEDVEKSLKDNNGKLKLKGIIQRADTKNQNGRVYPEAILRNEIENYKQLVKERRSTGELDHADEPVINLQKVSHLITDIWVEDDGTVMGEVEILRTPMGNIVKNLIEDGVTLGISSRALGSVTSKGDIDMVEDDLHIICWDFVSEPSTPGAFMFKENKDYDPSMLKKIFNREERLFRTANEILKFNNEIKGNK